MYRRHPPWKPWGTLPCYYVVTQRSFVLHSKVYVDAARSVTPKLSLPRTIKTAAHTGYCSAGSYGDLRNPFFSTPKGLSVPRCWIGAASVILQPWHFYGIAEILTTHGRQPLGGSSGAFFIPALYVSWCFPIGQDLFQAAALYLGITRANTLTQRRSLHSGWHANRNRWAGKASPPYQNRCARLRAHTP